MRATSDFSGGNGVVLAVDAQATAATVRFLAEPRGSSESLYWRLKVSEVGGRSVVFHWSQCQNCLGAGNPEKILPVWRDGGGPWQRVPETVRVDEPLGAVGLRWTLRFQAAEGEVAFIYPYEEQDLDAALAANPHWQRHTIGLSGQGRPLTALALGPYPAPRGLFIVTRQHCNETTGPWVLDGFLRAAQERPEFGVIAIPAVDLDGALAGDYGKDKFPQDFNRAWSNSTAMRPETLAIRRLMQRWHKAGARPLALDLHSPGAAECDGPYFFAGRMVPAHAGVLNRFFDASFECLPERLRGARDKFVRLGDYASRWPHENSFADNTRAELDWPATSLETPYQGSATGHFTLTEYRAIGAALWQAAMKTIDQR